MISKCIENYLNGRISKISQTRCSYCNRTDANSNSDCNAYSRSCANLFFDFRYVGAIVQQVHEKSEVLQKQLRFGFHQISSIWLFRLERQASQQSCYGIHARLIQIPIELVQRYQFMSFLFFSKKRWWAYLVMELTSPELGGAIWWELPMTQSVRYSTNLLRNFISWRKAKSSRRAIIVSTNWHSFVLMWIAWTVVSKWRT